MENVISNIKKDKIQVVLWISFVISFIVFIVYLNFFIDKWLDSDIASLLVLSDLLNEEGKIVSDGWYYSTELVAFSYQLLFAPLFSIFDNWHTIRMVGTIILFVCFLVSVYYVFYQCKLQKIFPLLGCAFLFPFSSSFFEYIIKNIAYVPYLAISFFAIGLQINYINCVKKKLYFYLICLNIFLSFFSGLNGVRICFSIYVPLFFVSILFLFKNKQTAYIDQKTTKLFFINCLTMCTSFVAYVFNNLFLADRYSFVTYSFLSWQEPALNNIFMVLSGWLSSLGYISGKIFSIAFVQNILVLAVGICTMIAIIQILTKKIDSSFELCIYASFVLFNILSYLLLYLFTNMSYVLRYNIFVTIFWLPLTAMFLSNLIFKYKKVVIFSIVFAYLVCSANLFIEYSKQDNTAELRDVIEILNEKGYTNGYSTFWQAGVTTELSNGRIDMWAWQDANVSSVNNIFGWLQRKEHEIKYPEGKVFILVTEEENNKISFLKNLDNKFLIYPYNEVAENKYYIYGFDSYEDMLMQIGQFDVEFTDNQFLNNGLDEYGIRHLYNGGVSYGPYITLYPGTYAITCYGNNLKSAIFDAIYRNDNEQIWLELHNINCSDKKIYFEIFVDKELQNFEARFFNNTDNEVWLTDLNISRLGEYHIDLHNGNYLINGVDENGVRRINADGISYGPYITLPAGNYIVYCKGVNLDNLQFDSLYRSADDEMVWLTLNNVVQSNVLISYEFQTNDVINKYEARFYNKTDIETEIQDITIVRLN